ncbi:MAG: hypothetical protein AB7N76_23310 [Planctomycetota bacterium]
MSRQTLSLLACLLALGCHEDEAPATDGGWGARSASSQTAAPLTAGAAELSGDDAATTARPRGDADELRTARSASRSMAPRPAARDASPTHGAARAMDAVADDAPSPTLGARDGLVLSAALEGEGEARRLTWTLSNQGALAVWVFGVLPSYEDGAFRPGHRLYARRRGETLHLTRRLWQIPQGIAVAIAEVPWLVRLEPGEALSDEVPLGGTARPDHPYQRGTRAAREAAARPHAVHELQLSYGYLVEGSGPEPHAVPGPHRLARVGYAGGLAAQRFVLAAPLPCELTVLD